jgi:hypothetical protein
MKREREARAQAKKDRDKCWNCKKKGHKSFECTEPKQEEEEEERTVKRPKRESRDPTTLNPSRLRELLKQAVKKQKAAKQPHKTGKRSWQKKDVMKLVKQPTVVDDDEEDEDEDDEGDDGANMIGAIDDNDEVQSVFMTQGQATNIIQQRIFLDSCASTGLLIVKESNFLDHMETSVGHISLTRRGAFMSTQGIGSKGTWTGITVCKESVKNICAVDRLKSAGYGLSQLEEDWVVDLDTKENLIKCSHHNGMPYILMADLFTLEDKSNPC